MTAECVPGLSVPADAARATVTLTGVSGVTEPDCEDAPFTVPHDWLELTRQFIARRDVLVMS